MKNSYFFSDNDGNDILVEVLDYSDMPNTRKEMAVKFNAFYINPARRGEGIECDMIAADEVDSRLASYKGKFEMVKHVIGY